LDRYIACGQVTKRPIFEFISSDIRPNAALIAFPVADDYSFGILQSGIHWLWFKERCSTLKGDFRYTSDSVFDTFPWPQSPTLKNIRAVAEAALALRNLRHEIMHDNGWSLRQLYKSLETPGENRLRDAHAALDSAVRAAYGMKPAEDILAFLLKLNLELADKESDGKTITPPGLPEFVKDPKTFISADCVSVDKPKTKDLSTAESVAAAAKFYSIHEEPPPYGRK
jgi:MmeI, target recognition domain